MRIADPCHTAQFVKRNPALPICVNMPERTVQRQWVVARFSGLRRKILPKQCSVNISAELIAIGCWILIQVKDLLQKLLKLFRMVPEKDLARAVGCVTSKVNTAQR